MEESPDVAAATVVLVRDADDGMQALLVRRSSDLAFAGGAWVFPGGRLESSDAVGMLTEQDVARRAAVRETHEETGLALDESTLVPLAHWLGPPGASKRYATWFYLAPAPSTAVEVDHREILDATWIRPSDALVRQATGDLDLLPPTWVTLHGLSRFARVDDAIDDARARDPELFESRVAVVDGVVVALFRGDAGFEAGDPSEPGARRRLWMTAGGSWRLELRS